MKRYLGIDPGLATTGYGVIETDGRGHRYIVAGTIRTSSSHTQSARLLKIFRHVQELLLKYAPEAIIMEELFFARNTTSAFYVAQAMGVVSLAAAMEDIPVYTYAPQMVKQAIVGHGRADKAEIQRFLRLLLNLPDTKMSDHASDALAIALCHVHQHGTPFAIQGGEDAL